MHLYFIRHGESTSNYGELITGRQNAQLTNLGRVQASAAGHLIAGRGIKIDHIICSPLDRAHDTAKLIAKEINYPEADIEVNDRVIERSFGKFEGQPNSVAKGLSDEAIVAGGGEIDAQIRERAHLLLESLKNTEGNVLVVSHTGFGRRLRAVILGVATHETQNFKNADFTDLGEI